MVLALMGMRVKVRKQLSLLSPPFPHCLQAGPLDTAIQRVSVELEHPGHCKPIEAYPVYKHTQWPCSNCTLKRHWDKPEAELAWGREI